MAEISLTAAFSTVPAPEQEAIKRLLGETIEQLAQEDRTFSRARVVFTESDERCGLTAELDGVKKEGVPLQLDSLHDFRLSLGDRSVVVQARVVHSHISNVGSDRLTYRTGIEFVGLSEPVTEAIAGFIEAQAAERLEKP